MAMMQLTHTTFDSCDPEEWILTNTTLNWINNTKIISCNITYKEEDNSTIYRIRITVSNCRNRTICTGEPKIQIDNINCNSQNLSKSDMDVCKIANELGKFEREEQWLKLRYGFKNGELLSKMVFCINIEHADLSWNDTEYK